MDKEIIKQGIAEAEKEAQQKQIDKVKEIVKNLLTKISEKKELEEKIRAERKLLEKDLDDLKAGRLDRIEERQKIDPEAKENSTIIIKRIEKEYIPYYPWRSPWYVGNSSYCSDVGSITLELRGTDFQNFSSGSYEINGKIINL